MYDTSSVRCITSGPGLGAVTVATPIDAGDPGIVSGDTGMVTSPSSPGNGLYPVTGGVYPNYSLGAQVDFLPSVVNSGNSFFGKLRWPDAPGIRGEMTITGATVDPGENGPILITVEGVHWLRTGDEVVIADCGNNDANGTWPITRVSDNSFSLNESHSLVSSGTSGSVHSRLRPRLTDLGNGTTTAA